MEGMLWKWTNYFSGWQSRWFVLETGILSYYKSQEDVVNGCKGSIKMSVCDVTVHPTDTTRLDLIIPGEAHFYVGAATAQERQEWLIALGSCKAGQHPNTTLTHTSTVEIPEEQLKSKKSELRLYCDLLMQQVHSVKTSVTEESTPDIQRLNEATSLLSATCDTFIHTLDDCMTLVNITHSSGQPSPGVRENVGPPTPTRRISKPSWPHGVQRPVSQDNTPSTPTSATEPIVRGYIPSMNKVQRSSYSRSLSNHSQHSSGDSDNSPSHSKKAMELISESGGDGVSSQIESMDTSHNELANERPASLPLNDSQNSPSNHSLQRKGSDKENRITYGTSAHGGGAVSLETCGSHGNTEVIDSYHEPEQPINTFFNTMEISFQDVSLTEDSGVPTEVFLRACQNTLPMFDKLNPTAFAPIKMEFTGNVRKIQQKYSTDVGTFHTLQNMILYEMRKQHHIHANSATNALLWLKRGLDFIREFLLEFMTGTEDLQLASNNAYTRSLKPYHSYVVRGVFALAAKSAPSRQSFITGLAGNPSDVTDTSFERHLSRQVENFIQNSDRILSVINEFYTQHKLHVTATDT